MIREHDVAALLQLRARLMRLALVADRYGEDLDGFDVRPAGWPTRRTAGAPRRPEVVSSGPPWHAPLTGR